MVADMVFSEYQPPKEKPELNRVVIDDHISLRSFLDSDAKRMTDLINTDNVKYNTTINLPWSLKTTQWWISYITHAATLADGKEVHYVIEYDQQLVGSIGLIHIKDHRCEIGYWLGDDFIQKGIMTKVIGKMVDIAFKEHYLARIFAPVLPHNIGSPKVLERNGFKLEGTLKDFYKKDGKLIDALAFARTRST